jgi:hypothetical protein
MKEKKKLEPKKPAPKKGKTGGDRRDFYPDGIPKIEEVCPYCGTPAGSEYFRDGQCICGYIVGMG